MIITNHCRKSSVFNCCRKEEKTKYKSFDHPLIPNNLLLNMDIGCVVVVVNKTKYEKSAFSKVLTS